MRASRGFWGATAVVATAALLLTACGGGGSTENKGSGAVDANASVSVYGTEPENSLIPANTNELGGSKALKPVFSALIGYKSDTAEPYNLMAESITTTDSKVFDIKIKKGWKFHDGTEVKAKNFVDAWNYSANGKNGMQNASFFEQIQGYDEISAKEPAVKEMSGLKV
ncbi:ABC transporter substrate-binding protein, partial [Amycolatopsis lurida]